MQTSKILYVKTTEGNLYEWDISEGPILYNTDEGALSVNVFEPVPDDKGASREVNRRRFPWANVIEWGIKFTYET